LRKEKGKDLEKDKRIQLAATIYITSTGVLQHFVTGFRITQWKRKGKKTNGRK
jgi:hypothetical protein